MSLNPAHYTWRLYALSLWQLLSIQKGIQAQHADRELTNKYVYAAGEHDPAACEMLKQWSLHDKTTIVLNGGNYASLKDIYGTLESAPPCLEGVPLPFAKFHEDEDSLGGIMTCVAVVLPHTLYDAIPFHRLPKDWQLAYAEDKDSWFWIEPGTDRCIVYAVTTPEARLLSLLKACPLAL